MIAFVPDSLYLHPSNFTTDGDGREFNCTLFREEFYNNANDTTRVFDSTQAFGGLLPGTPGVGFEVVADTLKGFINATLTAQLYFEDANATLDAAFQWRGINSTANVIFFWLFFVGDFHLYVLFIDLLISIFVDCILSVH